VLDDACLGVDGHGRARVRRQPGAAHGLALGPYLARVGEVVGDLLARRGRGFGLKTISRRQSAARAHGERVDHKLAVAADENGAHERKQNLHLARAHALRAAADDGVEFLA